MTSSYSPVTARCTDYDRYTGLSWEWSALLFCASLVAEASFFVISFSISRKHRTEIFLAFRSGQIGQSFGSCLSTEIPVARDCVVSGFFLSACSSEGAL